MDGGDGAVSYDRTATVNDGAGADRQRMVSRQQRCCEHDGAQKKPDIAGFFFNFDILTMGNAALLSEVMKARAFSLRRRLLI
ncbi:hypothetical protein WL02_12290 [Burkholderia ubonensis]|nr:hypothetical protein WL02_12290 [Burkholderia ubonensis]